MHRIVAIALISLSLAGLVVLGVLAVTLAGGPPAMAAQAADAAPAPAPPPATAAAAADDGAIHVDISTLASVAMTAAAIILSGVIGGVKLIRDGYVGVLRAENAGLREQLKAVMEQNSEQLNHMLAFQAQLAGFGCPHVGPDGVCRRPATPAQGAS